MEKNVKINHKRYISVAVFTLLCTIESYSVMPNSSTVTIDDSHKCEMRVPSECSPVIPAIHGHRCRRSEFSGRNEFHRTNSWRKSLAAPLIQGGNFILDLFREKELPKDKQPSSLRTSTVKSGLLKEMDLHSRFSDGYGLVIAWGVQNPCLLARLPENCEELSEVLDGKNTLVIHGNILSREPARQVALLNQLKECSERGELTLKNLVIIDTALKFADLSWLWKDKSLEGIYFVRIKGFQDGVFRNLKDSSLKTVCFGRCQITPDNARDIAPALQKIQDFRLDAYIVNADAEGAEMEMINVIADNLTSSRTLSRFSAKGLSNVIAMRRLVTAAANNILNGGVLKSFEMRPFLGKLEKVAPNPLSVLQRIVPFHVDIPTHANISDDSDLSPKEEVEKAIELEILSEEQRKLATAMTEWAFAQRRVATQQEYMARHNVTGEDQERLMEAALKEENLSRLNFEEKIEEEKRRRATSVESVATKGKKPRHHRKNN